MVAEGWFRRDGVEEVRGKMGLSLERKVGEEWEMGVKCVKRRGRDETEGIESNLMLLMLLIIVTN